MKTSGELSSAPTALERAFVLLGGPSKLARLLGIKRPSTVTNWVKRGVPAEYCPAIERLTHGEVKCESLNCKVDWGYLRRISL